MRLTIHNLLHQKKLINNLKPESNGENEIATEILNFEEHIKQCFMPLLSNREKELIFPTIIVNGIKVNGHNCLKIIK